MKTRLHALALALALCLALCVPASALSAENFSNGRLSGVCADGGALLVTDTYNKVVWRVEGSKVTRFAGAIGVAGLSGEPVGAYHDDLADKSYFMEPWDVVPFLDGCAVSDSQANVIRYIAGGRVYTLAGTGKAGKADGDGKSALFDRPTGLAVDGEGTLYVADTGNGAIRRVSRDGKVSTVVSNLVAPTGICWYDGALYVAETGRSRICRVTGGYVEVLAGASTAGEDEGEYYGGYADAPVLSAKFDHPQGVCAGADGTIYVADTGNSAIRAIRGGRVYTLTRGSSVSAPVSPRGLLVSGSTLRVADQFIGSLLDVSLTAKTYSDVAPGVWYAAAVESATLNNIVGGTGDGLFDPDGRMDRAMFVTMLSRLHLLTDGTVIIDGNSTFSDVAENSWYAPAVRWSADLEIVRGSDGAFAPSRGICREEIAVMLYRYAEQQGLGAPTSSAALDGFPDAGRVSSWATAAMQWATGKGILKGDGDGNLLPGVPATRAQALTMLLNFMNAYSL